ncbi:hypothetical protein FGE12_23715 [Aggregicoccus sp. 17bor-14]|uniref:hypothetical protein n=1 Tax=Myxococcaceae TaxID=31 RepID=UPI00129C2C96|nr:MULTISPECIES: hypothetical protein [Myxococcaceae]MBF5045434.1 hypothetical protein [Simulacricoccus sp. 17bor-14]MRI91175.1 hypothetical protein [Aggregicoccus sp. 17bor-14]
MTPFFEKSSDRVGLAAAEPEWLLVAAAVLGAVALMGVVVWLRRPRAALTSLFHGEDACGD